MESKLFDWSGWDRDQECMTFYNPVLKVPIGEYPIGYKFSSAVIIAYKSIIEFYNEEDSKIGNPTVIFEINYSIGKQL